MSSIPLENIEEKIERSFFEAFRLELVDKGYIPDIVNYDNTPASQTQWEADLKVIKDGVLGFAIEIFSTAGYQDRNTKKVPRVVINVQDFLPGALGGDQTKVYTKGQDDYTAEHRPPQSVNYYLHVHLIANTIKQLRILQAVMALALPRRGYIKFYEESSFQQSGNLFIQNLTSIEHPQTEEGIMEKVYRYEAQDIYETNNAPAVNPLTGNNVYPPIQQIDVDIDNDGNVTEIPPIT